MAIHDLASACVRAEELCHELHLEIVEQKDIAYGRQFKVGFGGATTQFNVYYGKKGLNVLAQGNDNVAKQAVEKLVSAMYGGGSNTQATKLKSAGSRSYQTTLSDAQFQAAYDEPWIGTDETGKGDFFGPLITAGVIVDPEAVDLLRSLGVDDSKKITDAKIPGMAAEIRKICYGKCNVIQLVPAKYNELYSRMQAQGKSLTHLLAWMHATVLENLLQRQPVKLAVADKFADERHIINQLKDLGKNVTLIQVTKGERNVAVAAASILARDALLTWHTYTQQELEMVLPKGATDVINKGRQYVRKFGTDALANVAKLHFKTTQEVLNGITA